MGVVHRLIGHAGRHRPVADHRNRLAGLARKAARCRKAERRRDGGGAVRRPERIIVAFRPAGEAREPPPLSQRPDRSEEHTSELQPLMRNSYAVFCLKKKKITRYTPPTQNTTTTSEQ